MNNYKIQNILEAFEPFKNIKDEVKITEQDAAHIVHAVNILPEMIEALEGFIDLNNMQNNQLGENEYNQFLSDFSKLLKKAKEGAE